MIKIAIINLKGGVGKSVTTVNLAAELAAMGNSLLVIDLDKQANTTKFYDCLDYEKPSMADCLTLDKPIAACLRKTNAPGITLLPANMNLLRANREILLDVMSPQQTRLREALQGMSADYCLMDCPPDLDMGAINALVAADYVIVPVDCDEWALDGLNEILDHMKFIERHYNPELKLMGVLVTKYLYRKHHNALIGQIGERDLKTFHAGIRCSVKVQEATAAHKSLRDFGKPCPAGIDYHALALEVEQIATGVSKVDTEKREEQTNGQRI